MAATESRDPAEALLCVLTEGEAWRLEQQGGIAGRRAGGVQGAPLKNLCSPMERYRCRNVHDVAPLLVHVGRD